MVLDGTGLQCHAKNAILTKYTMKKLKTVCNAHQIARHALSTIKPYKPNVEAVVETAC